MNKLLYKIELYLVKVIPMIYALLSLLNTTLSYFDINTVILSYIGSVSFITLLFLYITSYVFKFCEYHRMFIHYTTNMIEQPNKAAFFFCFESSNIMLNKSPVYQYDIWGFSIDRHPEKYYLPLCLNYGDYYAID